MLKPMDFILSLAAVVAIMFAAVSFARASGTVYVEQDDTLNDTTKGPTGGLVIDAQPFNSGVWTTPIRIDKYRSVCFDIFHDYNGNPDVTMRCETHQTYGVAADAGYDLHSLGIAGGAATSSPLVWTYTTGADKKWSWCVDNVPGKYINCLFDTSGSDAADDLSVTARGLTP